MLKSHLSHAKLCAGWARLGISCHARAYYTMYVTVWHGMAVNEADTSMILYICLSHAKVYGGC